MSNIRFILKHILIGAVFCGSDLFYAETEKDSVFGLIFLYKSPVDKSESRQYNRNNFKAIL